MIGLTTGLAIGLGTGLVIEAQAGIGPAPVPEAGTLGLELDVGTDLDFVLSEKQTNYIEKHVHHSPAVHLSFQH